MVEFKSRYSNLVIPIPSQTRDNEYGERVQFSNGTYRTEDERIIKALRHIAAFERAGNNRMIEETAETDNLKLTGIIHLELAGLPSYKLVVENNTIQEIGQRIKELAEIPMAQNPHRLDELAAIEHPVVPDPRYIPFFG